MKDQAPKHDFWSGLRHSRALTALAGVLLAACSATPQTTATEINSAPSSSEISTITVVGSVEIIPNFANLRTDGKCENAAEPPCVQPFRWNPSRDAPYMNHYPGEPGLAEYTPWPRENRNYSGDTLTTVCQVAGETISDGYGNTSNVWNVVQVPWDHLNIQTQQKGVTPDAPFGVMQLGDQLVAYGFVPAIWNQLPEGIALEPCTATENKGNDTLVA